MMDYTVVAETECPACSGTGLYQGSCEGKGTAVVCIECNGTGCKKISYKPFLGRKEKSGVVAVYKSQGNFMFTGAGPAGRGISYREFKEGKMP